MPFFLLNSFFSFLDKKVFAFLLLLIPVILFSQTSNVDSYKKVVYQEMLTGKADVFKCSESGTKEDLTNNERAKSQAISCATAFQAGYGTNCWNDTFTTPDPACSVPPVFSVDCNGGKYRIPIAITIFECFDWPGTNYLQTEEGGFEPILNMDLNTKLVEVNELFANANIEFYEVNRQRVQDCDLYDFYQDTEPSTGFNDSNDDLIESASFDIPNAINLYFVGGLYGDHDCCGAMAFAPYPPGRDYSVLRYGTAVIGSNLAHELGHYFGLPHTYTESIDFNVIDGDGVPTGSLDNCDCLTQGDRICDTWPDPSFSHNCNHLGAGDACYITMTAQSQCDFDEVAYAEHIIESHPGVSPNLIISPNNGVTFSTTSSTVLSQNIMSNNFIFGCTTTFSPCQYKKIHDVALSDCRNYLCNATTTDYFSDTNAVSYEICIGDELPTFQAGNTVTRFDGSQYVLECFDWYTNEFDQRSEAFLLNSSSFTPTSDQINTAVAGSYEFWIAEVNALNDPPCKVKVTLTVMDSPGTAITATNEASIDACTERNFLIDASGASINNNVDLIGWYFSNENPTMSLTTSTAVQTAIQSATNNNNWNSTTGNIVQSDANEPLSSLSEVSIHCNTLGNGTYFLTPFIAKGAVEQNCSVSSSSSSFDWNTAIGFTGGATVNLGPINDCAISGLSVDDFSITLNILDCESVGGDIGAKIYFNRGTELSINTPFDFTFDCTQEVITISGNDLRNLKADYDPMVDQIQINFINTNFFRTNFQGTIALSLNAKIDVNYSGNNAQTIWDANGYPNIDTSNIACFWGDPISVLCDCETSLCPEIGPITGTNTICSGDTSAFLQVDGIQNIGDFNMEFVYFNNRQTDSSLYLTTPTGLLGTGLMVEQVPYPTEAGTYYVYARLDPVPMATTCRPFQELVVEIIDVPAAPIANDVFYCEGDSIESLDVVGLSLLWYDVPIGGIGTERPLLNLIDLDTQRFWVSQTINACESPRTKQDIIRINIPSPPAIPDMNLCMGDEAGELVEGIPNLKWYTTETSTVGTSTVPLINTTTPGTTTYWLSQTDASNTCESERVPITVTINAFPAPPEVVDVSYFVNDQAVPLTAIGNQLRWYTNAVDTGTSIAPIPTTDSVGIQIYRVTQTTNNCESVQGLITVTIQERPPLVIEVEVVSPTNGNNGSIRFTDLLPDTSYVLSYTKDSIVVVDTLAADQDGTIVLTNLSAGNYSDISFTGGGVTSSVGDIVLEAVCNMMTVLNSTDTICAGADGFLEVIISNGKGPYQLILSDGVNNYEFSNYISGTSLPFVVDSTTTYTLLQLVDSDSCTIDDSLNQVTIVVLRTAAPLVNDTTYCQGEQVSDLMAEGMNLTWYEEEIGGDEFNIIIPSTDSIGIENYWVSQTINGCESERSSMSVTIEARPNAPTISDVHLCMGDPSVTLGEGIPNLKWYKTETSTESTLVAPIINSDAVGTATYWVSRLEDNCESDRAPVVVSIHAIPPAPILEDISYFVNETAIPLTAIGNELRWYTNTIDTGSSIAPIPTTDTVGVQIYRVTQIINNCESVQGLIRVTIQEQPVVEINTEVIDPTNGDNGSIRFTGLLPDTTYILSYTKDSIVVVDTIMTDQNGEIVLTGLSAGNYNNITFTANGITHTVMDIVLNPACDLLAVLSGTNNICIGENAFLNVTISNGKGPYNLTLSDGINNYEYANYVSGTNLPFIIDSTTTYTLLQLVDSDSCITDSVNQFTVIVNSTTTPVGSDITYCQGEEAIRLMADGINLLWYAEETGGTGLDSIIPSTDSAGIQTYWVSQSVNDCESERARLIVTIIPKPSAPDVIDVMYCQHATELLPLSAVGTNIIWYTSESGGIGSPMPPIPNTDVMGTATYWVSQTINTCESERARLNVIIGNDQPDPPIVESVTYCQGETTSPLNVEGENLRWYVLPSGGRGTTTKPQPTAELTGRYFHWVSQTINGCESDLARITITINERPRPELGLVIPPSPCQKDGIIQLRNLEPNQHYLLSYRVFNSPVTPYLITATDLGTYFLTGLAAGSYTDIKVQLGDCISDELQQILVEDTPQISVDFMGTTNICKGEAGQLTLNIVGGTSPYNLLITDIFNTYSLSDYESGTPLTVRPTKTTNYFLVSVTDSNGCKVMVEDDVVRMEVTDCNSMGSLQNEGIENKADLFSFEVNHDRLKNAETLDLFQNQPNPFSHQTTIGFYLPGNSDVELVLRDNTGRIIKSVNEYRTAGINHLVIDELTETTGLIYYQLITEFGTRSKKMLLVR